MQNIHPAGPWSPLRTTAALLLALLTLLGSGCGDSREQFVFTGANNNLATGNVVFNFIRPQEVLPVPTTTVSLEIEFFSGLNQTGEVTRDTTVAFAPTVTVTEVPVISQSYRVTARDGNGLPLQVTTDNIVVPGGQTVTVNYGSATTVAVTLETVTSLPDASRLAVGATRQFSLSGQFSNGESLNLPGATFVSGTPGVASITAAGLATAQSVGSTVITGTFSGVDDDATLTVTAAPVAATEIDVLVSNNGAANRGDLDLFDRLTAFVRTFLSGNNQGIAVDKLGTGFHSGDDPNDSVRILSRISSRTGAFDTDLDREITNHNFSALKGSTIAEKQGLMILADAGNSRLHVLGTAGTELLASRLMAEGTPWDVAYDEANDRLYVAFTNGTIGVFDAWIAGNFSTAATRTIAPAGAVNAHGIVFNSANNTLVVSDVGLVGDATDGQIFVIPNAGTAGGAVTPSATIAGAATELGNPVDIDLFEGDLRVAEKANNKILTFTGIFTTLGGNVAPTVSVAESAPESVTSASRAALAPDNSDIDGGITVQNLMVTTNPDGMAESPLLRLTPALTATTTLAIHGTGFESIKIDGRGDGYATFGGGGGGLVEIGRIGASVRDTVTAEPTRDRNITSDVLGGLKGLDVVDSRGVVIVARTGTPSILVFGKHSGSGEPIFTTPTIATPWDMDYDPTNDRLYVAFTNGTVGVYDNYLDSTNPNTAVPNRTITPNGSVNLHGIVHDAVNNVLLLSDVGTTMGGMSASDGKLFVVANASTANGAVTPTVTIQGAATNLGNPVDVAYDGTNLYVAEKSNDRVMRFDNIRSSAGGNVAPTASRAVTKPESISLITGL